MQVGNQQVGALMLCQGSLILQYSLDTKLIRYKPKYFLDKVQKGKLVSACLYEK